MQRSGRRKKKAAVFLDRDGTLNFDPGYLREAERFRFLPRVKPALGLLYRRGLDLFVISNQSGIGRGLITPADLKRIHRKMKGELKKAGVALRGIFVCPHSPEDGCACRKPSPKLIFQAARKHRLNLWGSFMVGDKATDVETGQRAGLQTVLISGKGAKAMGVTRPDHVAKDLYAAARWILRRHDNLEAGTSCAQKKK